MFGGVCCSGGVRRGLFGAGSIIHHVASFVSSSSRHPHVFQKPMIQQSVSFQSSTFTRRCLSSSTSEDITSSITLPNKTGDRNGLIRHEVVADDGHPLRVYSRTSTSTDINSNALLSTGDVNTKHQQRSILLLHGRTWSSQPVFDLRTSPNDDAQQSTLQSLAELGFNVYAMDFRGFGETPREGAGYTTPRTCVSDVKCVIDWITDRHGEETDDESSTDNNNSTSIPGFEDPTKISTKPALLGWSQGALVAQMYAQQHGPSTLSDLILFGSIYDPKVIYPRKPLYDPSGRLISGFGSDALKPPAPEVDNTDIASLEDFTLPGTICDEAALTFSKLALQVDTVKAAWDELHEFNMCNPALLHIPTMVIVGAQDPYVSSSSCLTLFDRLGTEDKVMCILPGKSAMRSRSSYPKGKEDVYPQCCRLFIEKGWILVYCGPCYEDRNKLKKRLKNLHNWLY